MKDLIPVRFIHLIKLTTSNIECMVRVQEDISKEFTSENGVRQENSFACFLSNIGLEKAVSESKIPNSGTIFNLTITIRFWVMLMPTWTLSGDQKLQQKRPFQPLRMLLKSEDSRLISIKPNIIRLVLMMILPRSVLIDLFVCDQFVYLGPPVNARNNVSIEI